MMLQDIILEIHETNKLILLENKIVPILRERFEPLLVESVSVLTEAVFQGKKVRLYKLSYNKGGRKKYMVYINSGKRDKEGNIIAKKITFGDKNMPVKRHIKSNRQNFRKRFKCDSAEAKYKDKKRYWNCKTWERSSPITSLIKK